MHISLIIFGAVLFGFVLGCIYSDVHWKPIVMEYKKAIEEYKKIFKH